MKMLSKVCLTSLPRQTACAAACGVCQRPYSDDIRVIKNLDTAFLKRGTGGRSSFNGVVATVFGATGFFGRILCNQLGKRGTQIIIPHRSEPDNENIKSLKLCGDLGQVLFQPFDIRDSASIKKAIKYSNVVINLIGTPLTTRNFSQEDVNVKGARAIAKACKEMNVERLIHFSTLNADQEHQRRYLLKLNFYPTKKRGEEAVMEEFPTATIFRPAPMYHYFDSFLWPLLNPVRTIKLSTALYAKGNKTIKQPVFATDVAVGVVNAINDYHTRGKIYQAVGPERYYLRDILTFCSEILQRPQYSYGIIHDLYRNPIMLYKLLLYRYIFEYLYFRSPRNITLENIELESHTDFVDRNLPTLIDLGVTLNKMEDKVPNIIMRTFRARPDLDLDYEEHIPASSLSAKALPPF